MNFFGKGGQIAGRKIGVIFICFAIILSLSSCSSLGTLLSAGLTLNNFPTGPNYSPTIISKEVSSPFAPPKKKDYASPIYNLDQPYSRLVKNDMRNCVPPVALAKPADNLSLNVIPGLVMDQTPFEDNLPYWGLEKNKEADFFKPPIIVLVFKLRF